MNKIIILLAIISFISCNNKSNKIEEHKPIEDNNDSTKKEVINYNIDSLKEFGSYEIVDCLMDEVEVTKEMSYTSTVIYKLKKRDSILIYDVIQKDYQWYFLVGKKKQKVKGYVRANIFYITKSSPVYLFVEDSFERERLQDISLPN